MTSPHEKPDASSTDGGTAARLRDEIERKHDREVFKRTCAGVLPALRLFVNLKPFDSKPSDSKPSEPKPEQTDSAPVWCRLKAAPDVEGSSGKPGGEEGHARSQSRWRWSDADDEAGGSGPARRHPTAVAELMLLMMELGASTLAFKADNAADGLGLKEATERLDIHMREIEASSPHLSKVTLDWLAVQMLLTKCERSVGALKNDDVIKLRARGERGADVQSVRGDAARAVAQVANMDNDVRWLQELLGASRYKGNTILLPNGTEKANLDPESLTCLACVLPAMRKWCMGLPKPCSPLRKRAQIRLHAGAGQVVKALKTSVSAPSRWTALNATQLFYAALVVRECERIARTGIPGDEPGALDGGKADALAALSA